MASLYNATAHLASLCAFCLPTVTFAMSLSLNADLRPQLRLHWAHHLPEVHQLVCSHHLLVCTKLITLLLHHKASPYDLLATIVAYTFAILQLGKLLDEGDWSWGHKAACKVAKACRVDGGGQLPSSSAQVCTCTMIIIMFRKQLQNTLRLGAEPFPSSSQIPHISKRCVSWTQSLLIATCPVQNRCSQ